MFDLLSFLKQVFTYKNLTIGELNIFQGILLLFFVYLINFGLTYILFKARFFYIVFVFMCVLYVSWEIL